MSVIRTRYILASRPPSLLASQRIAAWEAWRPGGLEANDELDHQKLPARTRDRPADRGDGLPSLPDLHHARPAAEVAGAGARPRRPSRRDDSHRRAGVELHRTPHLRADGERVHESAARAHRVRRDQ